MTRGIRYTVLACLAFALVVLALFVASILRQGPESDAALRERGAVVLPEARRLEGFALETASGEVFDGEDLRGGWTMLYFGFTSCPDVCPVTLATLVNARRALLEAGSSIEPFRVVMVSVDPERDTAERLATYVEAFSQAIVGVRGAREAVAELAEPLGVSFAKVPAPDGGYTVDHATHVAVVDPEGRYRAYLKFPHSVAQINRTYRALVRRG